MPPIGRPEVTGFSAVVAGRLDATTTVVEVDWLVTVSVADRVTVPEQPVPNVAVVLTLPFASVVPGLVLNVTTQPLPPPVDVKLTELPLLGAPVDGLVNVALKVTEPPGVTVVDEVEELAPALPT